MSPHNQPVPMQPTRNVPQPFLLALVQLLAIVFPLLAPGQQPPPISVQLSPFSIPGSLETVVNGVDNSGNMTGWFTDQSSSPHGFLFTPTGQLTVIDFPNFLQTVCHGVQGGAVVGQHLTPAGWWQAFYYSQGSFFDLPITAGVRGSGAYGLNDKGMIVGWYQDASGFIHGFEWNGAGYKTIDVPGMVDTYALAINHGGKITLNAYDANGNGTGWLKKGKSFLPISVAGSTNTIPFGISDSGDIVFAYLVAATWHGGLIHKDQWAFYDQPQSFGTWLTGINRSRQIVGYFQSSDTQDSLVGMSGSYQK